MLENPTSLVSPIVGLTSLDPGNEFDSRHSQSFVYETIGENNSRIAVQELSQEHPENVVFKSRLVAVYVGLTDDLALRLASKHNQATTFCHSRQGNVKHATIHCHAVALNLANSL